MRIAIVLMIANALWSLHHYSFGVDKIRDLGKTPFHQHLAFDGRLHHLGCDPFSNPDPFTNRMTAITVIE